MSAPTPQPLIALIEDEEHLAQGLLFNLEAEGFRTHHESDGDAALAYLLAAPTTGPEKIAVIVLDCMLPGADGCAITRALRAAHRFTPILMLTARAHPQDILDGIEAGADDYLPKPFELSILLVRIRSLIRRTAWQSPESPTPIEPSSRTAATTPPQSDRHPERSAQREVEGPPHLPPSPTPPPPDTYTFNHRTIHFDRLELIAPNRTTHLTLMEADLLRYLTDRAGHIIPRKAILEEVWRVHADTDTRAVDNFIVRLRRYIEDDPTNPTHLTTVRGIGYRFLPNPLDR
jgi:DNA-binding response OmpR family regulator